MGKAPHGTALVASGREQCADDDKEQQQDQRNDERESQAHPGPLVGRSTDDAVVAGPVRTSIVQRCLRAH